MASLETAYEQVAILTEDFKNNEKYYISSDYSEAQARIVEEETTPSR